MPQVSVIVPVYNVETYLRQCLDSLVNQTFKDIEVICIDDGSTDSSGEILDRYAAMDDRIRVIHKSNSGYGNTMNVGLDHARGEYIAIVESDDFVDPDMIEVMYLSAVENRADITKADHYNYIRGEDYLCKWLIDFPNRKVFETVEYPQILEKANTIWSCLYRRDFLMENNIRFHETPGASYQDVSFAMQTWLWAKRIYFIENAFLHYRNDNPDSSMHNPDKIFCTFEEFEWLEELFADFWERNGVLEKYFIASKYHDFFSNYYRIASQYQYVFLLRFQEEVRKDDKKNRIFEEAFRPQDYSKLMELKQDVNTFFKKTGKQIDDMRLKLCSFENGNVYLNGVIDYLKNFSCIILYGAGKIGMRVAALLEERGVHPDYFAVTQKNVEACKGIPVVEIAELTSVCDTAIVILTVAEKSQYEMYKNLEKFNFRHVLRVDELLRELI